MIKQDISENQAKIAYLAIGSNLGDRLFNINRTKLKIESKKIRILKCSSNYESLSWPNINDPKFINIVIKIKTYFTPKELLRICNSIEKELGIIAEYDDQLEMLNKYFS